MAKNEEKAKTKKVDLENDVMSELPEEQTKENAENVNTGKDSEKKESDTLTAELEDLKQKYDKLNKEYLLSLADFDNYRKRTLREKADLLKSGGEDCLKRILPIVDDFERGLLSIGKETDVNAVKEGMQLIYNKFIKYLEQQGVKQIDTENKDFDTEYHEAVTTYPAPVPEQKGKIIDCMQKGYTLNDKVIRYAKVVVGE